jgi:hypothetical protein
MTLVASVSRLRVCLLVLICGALGCTEPDPADLSIETQATPFYLYQGEPVYLRISPTSLTVAADSSTLPALTASLAVIGVVVDSSRAMGTMVGHWILWLHPGTSIAAAATAAQTLRRQAGVTFASNTYLYGTPPTECTLWLINRLDVKYRASTSREQIIALHQRAGLLVEIEASGLARPAWRLRYPAGKPYTPLEITVAIYRHPYVEWAAADMVGCSGPTSGV